MPDIHDPHRFFPRLYARDTPESVATYAELHCKTNFSFLEGASHADELVQRAVELGYSALAITDRNSLAGVVRAHSAVKKLKEEHAKKVQEGKVEREFTFKLLIGAEITPTDAPPIVLLATDRAAYGHLCRLITDGRQRAPKGGCELSFDDIARYADGLLGLVCCDLEITHRELGAYRDVLGDRCYALAEFALGPDDQGDLLQLHNLVQASQVPLVAAGNVHYHDPMRAPLHDVLTALRHGSTVADAGEVRFANSQRHLKSFEDISAQFFSVPDAIVRTLEVASRCSFSLDDLRYRYPKELCPAGMTPHSYLHQLTWQGARRIYPGGVPEKVKQLLDHELSLIQELQYEAYFLTVWDLVRFANDHNILCQGRGSAANSAVCYCLGITSVDPAQQEVLFERFISKERGEAPDIDIDFEHERREEVLQYIYRKYQRERAGMTATVRTAFAQTLPLTKATSPITGITGRQIRTLRKRNS